MKLKKMSRLFDQWFEEESKNRRKFLIILVSCILFFILTLSIVARGGWLW